MWAVGPKQYDKIKEQLEQENININNIKAVKIVPYIYNMEEVLNCSDLVVARSGAMTITEISNLGKPSILVPLPNVSNDHQLYNAKVLEKIGAAKIILNKDLNEKVINKEIEGIVNSSQYMKEMGINANKNSVSNVEDKIYHEIKILTK